MDRLQIVATDDGLTASVRVGRGPSMNADDLRNALREAGIAHGIDEHAIEHVGSQLVDPELAGTAVVARGTASIDGEDGYLRGALLATQQPGKRLCDDRIDYRERSVLAPVATGDLVAEIVEPRAAFTGVDVFGNTLAARHGRPHGQLAGTGIHRNGDRLYATRDGVLLTTETAIDVVPLYAHEGSVDYASGNLHAGGSLLIKGDVDDGFEADATGDVAVLGDVQGGVTAGGSVFVTRGVHGREQDVRAQTDIECQLATATRLVAGRTIAVHDQIAQSELHADNVYAVDGRASVRGGLILTRNEVVVGHAGSSAGTTTTIATGQLLDERQELARRTAARTREQRKGTSRTRSKATRASTRAHDHERSEHLRLRRQQRELMRTATIQIRGECHEGVRIRIGFRELRLRELRRAVTFRYDYDNDCIICEEAT